MPEYIPTRALPFGHLMTIASALSDHVRPRPKLFTEAREFLVDDETKVLALCSWQPNRLACPTVLVHHGLTGNAGATNVLATAHKLYLAGFNAVRLNARNRGGSEDLTPTLYHSGLTDDLACVLDTLHAEGHVRLHAIGFSMGGNIVLKYAGERAPDARLDSVVAISPPIELEKASAAIDSGIVNRIYQRTFLTNLVDLVRKKAQVYPERYDAARLSGITTLRTFDDRFIAPSFGFADADDYYFRASAARSLEAVRIPTLVIAARDDSIVPIAPFEEWERWAPEHVRIVITDRGGHVGFVTRRSARADDPDPFWAENRAVDFVLEEAKRIYRGESKHSSQTR